MDQEMPEDAELLTAIIHEKDEQITVKWIARVTSRSIFTVYKYAHGEIRIPMSFWRDLFAASHDLRIAHLLLGGTNYEILLPDNIPDLRSDAKLFGAAIEAIEKFHAEQKYFAAIAKDGRIDETDRPAIERYRQQFIQFRMQHLAVFRAVNQAFELSAAAATK